MRRGKRPLACSMPTDNETDTTAAPHVFGPRRTPPPEQRTSHGQLDGALKRFEHVAWKDWPPWARAQFGRLHKPLRGAAALTVQMHDAGMPCGRCCATSSIAEQIDAAPMVSWSPSSHRVLAHDVLSLLLQAEGVVSAVGGDSPATCSPHPSLVLDAAGHACDVELLAIDAYNAAEPTAAAEPPSSSPSEQSVRQEGTSACERALPALLAPLGAGCAAASAETPTTSSRAPTSHARGLVGKRILVHWPADDAWYAAKVTTFSQRRGYCTRYDHIPGEQDRTEYEALDDMEWVLEPTSVPCNVAAPRRSSTVPGRRDAASATVTLPASSTHSSSPVEPAQPTTPHLPTPPLLAPLHRRPPPPAAPCTSLDFCLENPVNALWLMLFTKHPRFERWPSVVLSYCKLRSCATKYRKTTRFLSSIPSSATYAAPCSPSAPCAMVRNGGKHEKVIGEMERGRAVLGYYARSHVPASIVADYLESVSERRLRGGIKRLLVLDLCSGLESARAGMHAYQRRATWARHRTAGCEMRYVSVDNNEKLTPMLAIDLAEADMNEVVLHACNVAGWPPTSVAVFVWFSPPCETYSPLALGTNASSYWGGAQREGKEAAYTPTRGKRGAKARQADRLVCRVLSWLHRNAVR